MSVVRDPVADIDTHPVTASDITKACEEVFAERQFTKPTGEYAIRSAFAEETYWELFLGHALDGTKTRERRQFTTWALFAGDADEPLLAIRWDVAAGQIHVTRSILSRTHEGYDAGGGVYEVRDTIRRVRELIGTVDLSITPTAERLRSVLAELTLLGVVGLSRLPLTSVDAPLPEFTLGRLGYCYQAESGQVAELGRVKQLEFAIRSTPIDNVGSLATGRSWLEFTADFRAMFDAVSLSPWTDFISKALSWLRYVDGPCGIRRFEVLARLIVRIARHLNAYDLVTFHHFGANYPDALLVEACLSELLGAPAEARNGVWQQGVRAAVLVAAEYANHLVPDAPTSQGEAARVLPPEFQPVPDEQIASPHRRNRRLFKNNAALDVSTVRDSLVDLEEPAALIEMGTALFIDRPLGVSKHPGEPDHTWLSSHVLYSRTLAEKRLRRLAKRTEWMPDANAADRWRTMLDETRVNGIPLELRDATTRPGVASLQDAFMVADDFVFLRTTRRAVRDFVAQYDCTSLFGDFPMDEWHAIVPTVTDGECRLTLFDRNHQPRVELEADHSRGFLRVGGTEFVAAGFRVVGDATKVLQAHSS